MFSNIYFQFQTDVWGGLSDVEKKELYDKIGYKENEPSQKLPDDVSRRS